MPLAVNLHGLTNRIRRTGDDMGVPLVYIGS